MRYSMWFEFIKCESFCSNILGTSNYMCVFCANVHESFPKRISPFGSSKHRNISLVPCWDGMGEPPPGWEPQELRHLKSPLPQNPPPKNWELKTKAAKNSPQLNSTNKNAVIILVVFVFCLLFSECFFFTFPTLFIPIEYEQLRLVQGGQVGR